MARRKIQSSRQGAYSVNLPKDLAEALGITTGKIVNIDLKGKNLVISRT